MNRNIIETLMGAIVLAVAGFFIVFAYKSSGIEKRDGILLKAQFDRVDGLVIGSDVRLSGVKVGSVTTMTVDPQSYLAEVLFVVDPHIPLPVDSSAEIISSGLLGDKYLALVPGGAETFLKNGEAVQHTQSSISLESMIGQLIFSNKGEKQGPSQPQPAGSSLPKDKA